jgi:hypothetical protein
VCSSSWATLHSQPSFLIADCVIQIKLYLPGLVLPEKDAAASSARAAGDVLQAYAAAVSRVAVVLHEGSHAPTAADSKTKKKLSKLARLAQSTPSSSSSAQPAIEVDLAVLADGEADVAPDTAPASSTDVAGAALLPGEYVMLLAASCCCSSSSSCAQLTAFPTVGCSLQLPS